VQEDEIAGALAWPKIQGGQRTLAAAWQGN
jgi:hypothetical protein